MVGKVDDRRDSEPVEAASQDLKWLSMQDFQVGRPLGKGAFGSVYLVRHKRTHYPYAVKVLYKNQIVECTAERHIANEIELQGRLDHPHIAKMKSWWQSSDKLFFLFEYCHWKSLFDVIQKDGRLEMKYGLKIFSQIVDAVDFCHKNKIIHRDIKPENILLWRKDHVKLSDFGWSACTVSGVKNTTICGTTEYMAPELVSEYPYNYKVDNWALGVLLYEIIHGISPFASKSEHQCRANIMMGKLNFHVETPEFIRDIVTGLTIRNPRHRIEIEKVKKILEENV